MTSGTYRPYKGRGRRVPQKRSRTGKTRPASTASREQRACRMQTRLVVCLFIAAVFAIARLIFPSAFSAASDSIKGVIGSDVDLKSAAYVIGEAINGDKSVSEAFSEACSYAFGIERDDGGLSGVVEASDIGEGETHSA